MPEILDPEWRGSLATTKYPFADTASLSNNSGDFIPEGIFLDASLYVIGAKDRLYIAKIEITADSGTLTLNDSTKKAVATATFNLLDPPSQIQVLDLFGRPAGILVTDPTNLAIFQAWIAGSHEFQIGTTEFVARVTIPTPEIGVRGFLLDDGTLMTGDVWFVGGDGVVLTPGLASIDESCSNPAELFGFIRVDIVGDPLYRRKLCDPVNLFQTPRFLKKLRVLRGCDAIDMVPDEHGGIRLGVGSHYASDTVLRVRTTSTGLVIETVGSNMNG